MCHHILALRALPRGPSHESVRSPGRWTRTCQRPLLSLRIDPSLCRLARFAVSGACHAIEVVARSWLADLDVAQLEETKVPLNSDFAGGGFAIIRYALVNDFATTGDHVSPHTLLPTLAHASWRPLAQMDHRSSTATAYPLGSGKLLLRVCTGQPWLGTPRGTASRPRRRRR